MRLPNIFFVCGAILLGIESCKPTNDPDALQSCGGSSTSFQVKAQLAPNGTDVVLSWPSYQAQSGHTVLYKLIYAGDTLRSPITDTTCTLRIVGYYTPVSGRVLVLDNQTIVTCGSYSIISGDNILPRIRLKKQESSTGDTLIFNYDSQNRLSALNSRSTYGARESIFLYDNGGKNHLEIRSTESAMQYSTNFPQCLNLYSTTMLLRPITNSVVDYSYSTTISGTNYGLSNDKKYLYVEKYRGPVVGYAGGIQHYVYKYDSQGKNITRLAFNVPNNPPDSTRYDFDDKINPFFGSPSPRVGDVERFSRNNLTRAAVYGSSNFTTPSYVTTFAYEYNQLGLPVKCTVRYSNSNVITIYTYTYESY